MRPLTPIRNGGQAESVMIFHQLFEAESSTYTYLLADEKTGDAILVDPVVETLERDLTLVHELGLKLLYVLDTHVHADHVTSAGTIRDRLPGVRTGVSHRSGVACADLALKEGDRVPFGRYQVQVYETPGHTDSCLSFFVQIRPADQGFEGLVLTGDALLIRGCGRTDFQQGSSGRLFESVTSKLFTLPPETKVYPAHDYRGHTSSSIAAEKQHNPRLGAGRTKEEFIKIMSELKLAQPKKIHEALPANMVCGKRENMFEPRMENGLPEITPEDLSSAMKKSDWKSQGFRLIDVRRPDEYTGELGHIEGAELVTLGEDLQKLIDTGSPNQPLVFICRVGGRSGQATEYARQKGYTSVFNMRGGMLRWNEAALPVVKS